MDYRIGLFLFWSLFWSMCAASLIDVSQAAKLSALSAKSMGSVLAVVWASQVMAISFMEAWVKFGAPYLTRPAALDVGRRIFRAFNSMELAHAVALTFFASVANKVFPDRKADYAIGALALILLTQVLWLTPQLSLLASHCIASARKDELPESLHIEQERLKQVIAGKNKPSKALHALYIFFELVKIGALLLLVSIWKTSIEG